MLQKLKHIAGEYGTQILIVVAGISLIWFIGGFSGGGSHELEHAPAPGFTLASLSGQEVSLADNLGDVVVLDFFATWCPPCVKGMPILDKVAKEFEGDGVKVYAVNVGESVAQVESFMKSHNLGIEVLMDPDHTVADLYHVRGIPQTVIIGPHGLVHSVHVGVGSGFESELRRDIQAAMTAPRKPTGT